MRPIEKRRAAPNGVVAILVSLALAAGAGASAEFASAETLASAAAAATAAATTSDLRVEASSAQATGGGYVQVEGVISATVSRHDGSRGAYRVPVTLLYPDASDGCNGVAVVDVLNSVFYETFDWAGTLGDPFRPSLFPLGRAILGDGFLQARGYTYATVQWNKLVLERQRGAGTLPDSTLRIDRGTDGYTILRDLSDFLRRPTELLVGPVPSLCAARDVVAFGYSQTAMLLREFHFAGRNAGLALGSSFDDGIVFEGSLHGGPGSRCRRLADSPPWFEYTFVGCGDATPPEQGKVMTVNAETDLQLINAWKARAKDTAAAGHYRVYELAATAHIPTPLFPLKLAGARPAEQADQNDADTSPFYRAMMEHLRRWIGEGHPPPPDVAIAGGVKRRANGFFSDASWGSDNGLVFITRSGKDGNALGGVRLPHVRTALPDGADVGGPLGIYRGTHCDNDPTASDFILSCRLSGDQSIYNMAGGTFTPYAELDTDLCDDFYPTREAYAQAVRRAAEHAAAKGWTLSEETDLIVASAEQKAAASPGCVP